MKAWPRIKAIMANVLESDEPTTIRLRGVPYTTFGPDLPKGMVAVPQEYELFELRDALAQILAKVHNFGAVCRVKLQRRWVYIFAPGPGTEPPPSLGFPSPSGSSPPAAGAATANYRTQGEAVSWLRMKPTFLESYQSIHALANRALRGSTKSPRVVRQHLKAIVKECADGFAFASRDGDLRKTPETGIVPPPAIDKFPTSGPV